MAEPKATRIVIVANRAGFHARAATLVAKRAREFNANVELVKDDQRANTNDVLQMLSMGAGPGEQVVLEATGQDADSALDALVALFADKFGEDTENEDQQQLG